MAIIVVLATMLLPVVEKARARAKQTSCASRLRQIGLVQHAYAHEHNQRFAGQLPPEQGGLQEPSRPVPRAADPAQHWLLLSNGLVDPKLLVCPADVRSPARAFRALQNSNVSYFAGPQASLSEPDSVLSGDRNIALQGYSRSPVLRIQAADAPSWTAEQHQFRGNLLFSDGRVEFLTSPQLTAALRGASGKATVLWLPGAPSLTVAAADTRRRAAADHQNRTDSTHSRSERSGSGSGTSSGSGSGSDAGQDSSSPAAQPQASPGRQAPPAADSNLNAPAKNRATPDPPAASAPLVGPQVSSISLRTDHRTVARQPNAVAEPSAGVGLVEAQEPLTVSGPGTGSHLPAMAAVRREAEEGVPPRPPVAGTNQAASGNEPELEAVAIPVTERVLGQVTRLIGHQGARLLWLWLILVLIVTALTTLVEIHRRRRARRRFSRTGLVSRP